MTDQDPTQPYQPPAAPPPAAAPPYDTAPAAAPQAVATSPVATDGSGRRPGRNRAKWLVAAVVTLLVAGVAAGGTLMLTSSTAASGVQGWAPADTTTYYEVRLDLPGAQRAELAEFMTAFPGFADQAAFSTKLGEIGDRIVRAASEDKHDYQTEIAPWFGGQIAFAQGPVPTQADMEAGRFDLRMLVVVSVTDATKATAWIDGVLEEQDATVTTEAYGDTTITIVGSDDVDTGMDIPDYGYASTGKVVLAGDVTSLKAAIDTKGAGALSTTERFKAAQAALPGDQLVFFYTDYAATIASSMSSFGMFLDEEMVDAITGVYGKLLPEWAAGSLRAQDGRLVAEVVTPHIDALGEPVKRVDPIAAMAPADTIFLGTGADLGTRLTALKAMFDAEPAFDEALEQVDQALGVLGGFDALAGWMGDAGVVVTKQGDSVGGGLVVAPKDAEDARRLLTTLRTLVELGAQGMLTFEEEAYGGTTIVSLDLSELASLGAAMGGVDAGTIPADLTFAYAVADDAVVFGVGSQFVKDVLDARGGDSLADQARYSTLIDAAGRENAGVVWLDIAAIRGMVEPLLPAEASADYEKDVKPYLEPLDAVGGVTLTSAELDRSVMYFTVTK